MKATTSPFASRMPRLRFSAGRTLPVATNRTRSENFAAKAESTSPSGSTIASQRVQVWRSIADRHSSSIQLGPGQATTTLTSGSPAGGLGASARA